MSNDIKQRVKDFIMAQFLPGEDPDELTDDTPLISGGILDSIATLQLVMFMEENFRIGFEPHEVDREHLDTLTRIVAQIQRKSGQ